MQEEWFLSFLFGTCRTFSDSGQWDRRGYLPSDRSHVAEIRAGHDAKELRWSILKQQTSGGVFLAPNWNRCVTHLWWRIQGCFQGRFGVWSPEDLESFEAHWEATSVTTNTPRRQVSIEAVLKVYDYLWSMKRVIRICNSCRTNEEAKFR